MVSVSIIIPVYNVEPYITDCLNSVMRQTYQGSLECIVVDDCGTDNSIEVAEKLIAEYKGPIEFIIIHHEHNRGLSAARNMGMNAAKGDYVYYLDSDDWISDDCIEKLTAPLKQQEYDIVVGDYETVGELPYHLELSLPEGPYHETGITRTFCNGGVYVMAVNKLYRKEFMLQNRLAFEDGKIHEDEILAFELSCVEKSFFVVKAITYFYRIRENSIITGTDSLKKANGYIGVLQSVVEKVKQYSDVEGIYDYYLYWVKRIFGWITRNLDDNTRSIIDKQTGGYIDVVPSIWILHNKHNRLVYFACRKEQTYSRYQYVSNVYANKIQGRIMRNLLNLFPYKPVKK